MFLARTGSSPARKALTSSDELQYLIWSIQHDCRLHINGQLSTTYFLTILEPIAIRFSIELATFKEIINPTLLAL